MFTRLTEELFLLEFTSFKEASVLIDVQIKIDIQKYSMAFSVLILPPKFYVYIFIC